MAASAIKATISLIFTNCARNSLNYPYSNLYKLGIKDFTIQELQTLGNELTTDDFVNNSCFSNIDFSSTTRIEYSTDNKKTVEKTEVFIYATKKDQSECGAKNIDNCAYNIKHGLCPNKIVNNKLFKTFQQKEHS